MINTKGIGGRHDRMETVFVEECDKEMEYRGILLGQVDNLLVSLSEAATQSLSKPLGLDENIPVNLEKMY